MISQYYHQSSHHSTTSLSRSLPSYAHSLQARFRLIESTGDKLSIVRLFHWCPFKKRTLSQCRETSKISEQVRHKPQIQTAHVLHK